MAGRKQAFVDFLIAGETPQEAADRIQTELSCLRGWARLDTEFKEQCRKAIEDRKLLAQEKLSGSLDKAVEVVVKGLESQEEKLAIDDAHKILRGMGVTQERQEIDARIQSLGIVVYIDGQKVEKAEDAIRSQLQPG